MNESVQLSIQLIDNKIQRIRASQSDLDLKIQKLQDVKSKLSENISKLETEKQKLQNSKRPDNSGRKTISPEPGKSLSSSAMDAIRTMSGS